MYIRDIENRASNARLDKLAQALKEIYEVEVDFTSSETDLAKTYQYFEGQKKHCLQTGKFNGYFNNKEFSRAYLICEAIKIFLSEIAPKRKVRRPVSGANNAN